MKDRSKIKDAIEMRDLKYLVDRAAQLATEADEEDLTLALLSEDKVGIRAKTKRIARYGVQKLAANAQMKTKRQRAARLRACVALCMTREEMLAETGWSIQELMATEKYIRDEDDANNQSRDPGVVFGEYRERMMLCARELEDLGVIFRQSRQYSSLVNAVKARADIFEKIVDRGQELGLIKRQAKKVEIDGDVRVENLQRSEIEVAIKAQIGELGKIINFPTLNPRDPADAVLRRLIPTRVEIPGSETPNRRKPRVKRLAGG